MKILLLGRNGQVGWELQRSLSPLGDLISFDRHGVDLEDADCVRRCVRDHQPDIIVNAVAHTAVDKAEFEPEKARRINAEAVGILAEEAARQKSWLVHYSTDYVFDGLKASPYKEEDEAAPLSVYGRTKLEGEALVRQCRGKYLIFRSSWVYAARGGNFAKTILRLAQEKMSLDVVENQFGAPTSAELIADVTALVLHRIMKDAASERLSGTYHLAASGQTSWHGYARYLLELARANGIALKVAPEAVRAIPGHAYPQPAKRPANSCLDTTKLTRTFDLHLPHWHHHLQRLIDELTGRTLP